MAGFTSMDDLVNQITTNGKFFRADWNKNHATAGTVIAGSWQCLAGGAGNPPANSALGGTTPALSSDRSRACERPRSRATSAAVKVSLTASRTGALASCAASARPVRSPAPRSSPGGGADTTARTMTIPANSSVAYPIGTALTFVNQASAGVMTIAITTDTMRLAGAGTTGSRTLAANGIATAIKVTSTEWLISGTGLT